MDIENKATVFNNRVVRTGPANLEYVPKEMKEAARGMEKQFVQYMVEQMNKTVDRNKEMNSAEKYYNSLLDNERTDALSKTGGKGLGIQEMVLEEIYPRKFRNKAAFEMYQNQNAAISNKYKTDIKSRPAEQTAKMLPKKGAEL